MTVAGEKLISAAREAVAIARGEIPAGRVTMHNGEKFQQFYCSFCALGFAPTRLRGGRQYIHRHSYQNLVCPTNGRELQKRAG